MEHIKIDLLGINNFRNCEELKINLHPRFNVFTGLNGTGKTSILDALYYLTNGKSYFSYQDKYIYRQNSDFFRISGDICIGSLVSSCEIMSSVQKGKILKCDDKIIKSIIDYYGRFPAFMIAPKDILILIESSIERRKLINRTLSQVDKNYFVNLLNYNKLLKQRNAALKSFQKTKQTDFLLLEALDQKMLEPSVHIFNKREKYLEEIAPIFSEYYKILSDEKEQLSLSYKSSLRNEELIALRKNSQQKDIMLGKTNEGIHRDDLIILMNGIEIKKYASQGQLKSAIIALKLAQIHWVKQISGKIPILFLDDIFDKLDTSRVNKLIDICYHQIESQLFITDTDSQRVSRTLEELEIEHEHFVIEDGKIIV